MSSNREDLAVPVPGRDENGRLVVSLDSRGSYPTIFDPGLRNTAICKTRISHIDGRAGAIRYRGYALEDLVGHASYAEVAQLLLNGGPLSAGDGHWFEEAAGGHRRLWPDVLRVVSVLPAEIHPLVALSVGLAAGDSAVQNALPSEVGDSVEAAVALIGLSPGIMRALLARDRNIGNAIEFSDGSLTFIEAMLGAACGISRTVMASGEEQLRLLNTLLIAHAEHGMNCSTTAVRTLASAGAGAGASLAGGLLCFSGRFHGGAADRVAGMLRQIRESGLTAAEWLDLEIARRGPVRVYGFGHRIYRTEDPRAAILRSALDRFAGEDGYHDDLLGITVNLADAAAMHPYFRERMIWPNVDLYSGACFRALGIPEHLNSSVIAIGRMAGWLAHWREAVAENSPIVRPRDLYDGVMPELLWPG